MEFLSSSSTATILQTPQFQGQLQENMQVRNELVLNHDFTSREMKSEVVLYRMKYSTIYIIEWPHLG